MLRAYALSLAAVT